MKICFATDYMPGYHKNWAGAEQACYRLAKLLIKNKHQVTVLATKPEDSLKESFTLHPVSTIKDYLGGIGSYLKIVSGIDPVSAFSAYRVLKRIKPDVLHLQRFNRLSLSLIWSARRLHIPVVYSMYDHSFTCPRGTLINAQNERCDKYQGAHCVQCLPSQGKAAVAKRLGLLQAIFMLKRRVTDYFFARIDAFVVLSDSWGGILRQYGVNKERINIVPLPLFEKTDNADGQPKKGAILFVGWVHPHKGLHVLIEALPQVLGEVPEARLHVIESGVDEDYKHKVMSRMKELGIEASVSFLGKKSNKEVQAFLRRAEIVTVPEQWGISWPIFLTEAMACGKPIVASRIGDIPQFITDGSSGFLAEPQDPSDFALRIIQLSRNGQMAAAMGKEARKHIIEMCDESRILKKLSDVYVSAMKGVK